MLPIQGVSNGFVGSVDGNGTGYSICSTIVGKTIYSEIQAIGRFITAVSINGVAVDRDIPTLNCTFTDRSCSRLTKVSSVSTARF